jgi:3,4-dihydroxy 2-butanone 4-phosphate synthase/GTP cyclohydrolase II
MGNQQRLPSMMGYGLEVTGFLTADGQSLPAQGH